MTIMSGVERELQGKALWRRQRMRNLMDCYSLGMGAMSLDAGERKEGRQSVEALTRLMVEGMAEEGRGKQGKREFYRKAAGLCRESAAECERMGGEAGKTAGFLRIYGAIFEDLGGKGSDERTTVE